MPILATAAFATAWVQKYTVHREQVLVALATVALAQSALSLLKPEIHSDWVSCWLLHLELEDQSSSSLQQVVVGLSSLWYLQQVLRKTTKRLREFLQQGPDWCHCAAGGSCCCSSCAVLACPSIGRLQKSSVPLHGGCNCSVWLVPVQESQGEFANASCC